MNPCMRALLLVPFLAACGGSTTAVPPAPPPPPSSKVDCAQVCAPALVVAPRPPLSPCDGAPGGLLGKVLVDGKPAQEKIAIMAMSSCARYPAMSDDKGVFSMPALPLGDYVVEATVGTVARASVTVER